MLRSILILLCFTLMLLQGCAYSAFGVYDDKRLLDTMSSDNALASSIKSALIKKNFSKGLAISVYCYYKHVFLVGQIPAHLQKTALIVAQSKNPRSVTTHWFTEATAADSDFLLGTRLRTALIGAKGLSSTRVDTEINAGRVVLLGVVENEAERKIAIRTARQLDGVVKVTSYLMLPPSVHTDEVPSREDHLGVKTKPKIEPPEAKVKPTPKTQPTFEEKNI
ncbi:MAG: BON domain-containing protein [Desulfovibrionaceae bacterium]|nr:BON domain-containing protein [Desulfovibrionaceae bacterium]